MTRTITANNELKTLLSNIDRQPNQDFLPLANTPERFGEFLYFLRRQPGCRAHKETIANRFKITLRQAQFYSRAGDEIFGLFDTSEPGYVTLTALGKSMAYKKKEELNVYLKMQMQKMDIVRGFVNQDISADLSPVIQAIEEKAEWKEEYSQSSIERRASTIRSWVEFVREDSLPISETQLVQFVKEHGSILSHLFSMQKAV